MIILLTGAAGAGKSTVGERLARVLNLAFFDADNFHPPDNVAKIPKVAVGSTPDPEVAALLKRRQFSAAYKGRIVREADACQVPGEIGALLRREGLYSSHLTHWRREVEASEQAALAETGVAGEIVGFRHLAVREMPGSGKPAELLDVAGISARPIADAVKALVASGRDR